MLIETDVDNDFDRVAESEDNRTTNQSHINNDEDENSNWRKSAIFGLPLMVSRNQAQLCMTR